LVKPDSDAVVSCYPNPTQNKLHVALFSGSSQPIGILLCDLSGRVIDQILTSALPDSYHHFNIDMADLSSGLYLLKVDFRDSDQVIKIVRQ
jgi:hypothetical protein